MVGFWGGWRIPQEVDVLGKGCGVGELDELRANWAPDYGRGERRRTGELSQADFAG